MRQEKGGGNKGVQVSTQPQSLWGPRSPRGSPTTMGCPWGVSAPELPFCPVCAKRGSVPRKHTQAVTQGALGVSGDPRAS